MNPSTLIGMLAALALLIYVLLIGADHSPRESPPEPLPKAQQTQTQTQTQTLAETVVVNETQVEATQKSADMPHTQMDSLDD